MQADLMTAFFALATVQMLLYRIKPREALKRFWILGGLYLGLFLVVKGLHMLGGRLGQSPYELPLLLILLWLAARGAAARLPGFRGRSGGAPDFYLTTILWAGLGWFAHPVRDMVAGLLWSFCGAGLLPVLSAMKERLELADQPEWFAGLPAFLTAAGLLLLGFSGLVR